MNEAGAPVALRNALVVDDDPVIRKLIAMALRSSQRWKVLEASSGAEALQIATALDLDVILLDWLMPGMDGETTLRRLRATKATRDTPVIVVSATADDRVARGIPFEGAMGVIAKPFNAARLPERVEAILLGTPRKASVEMSALDTASAELRAHFAAQVPGRLRELAQAVALVRDTGGNLEMVRAAKRSARMLSGTAGSFGYTVVSAATGEIADMLTGVADGTSAANEAFFAALEDAVKRARSEIG